MTIESDFKEEFSINLNELIDDEDWELATKLILEALDKFQNEYYLWSMLAQMNYNQEKYIEALKFNKRAYLIEGNDPLVLYNYASSLAMFDNSIEEAVKIFTKILNENIKEIAYGEFGEGMKWARSIYNDSLYKLGECHLAMNNKKKAKQYITKHLENRSRGIYSDFSKKGVIKKLKQLR